MQQSRCLQQLIRHGLLLVGQDCKRNACDALKRICRGVLQKSQQYEGYPTDVWQGLLTATFKEAAC